MNTRPSFHSKTFPESQRDILGMIATDHHLGDILCAICQMLDDQAPETFCSILLTDAEGKRLLSGAAPSLPVEYSDAIQSCAATALEKAEIQLKDLATRLPKSSGKKKLPKVAAEE